MVGWMGGVGFLVVSGEAFFICLGFFAVCSSLKCFSDFASEALLLQIKGLKFLDGVYN